MEFLTLIQMKGINFNFRYSIKNIRNSEFFLKYDSENQLTKNDSNLINSLVIKVLVE